MSDLLFNLGWRDPLWLWLAAYPGLLWILRGFIERPRRTDYADPQLMPWARAQDTQRFKPRRLWRHGMLALAWALFAMAMAGPRLPQTMYDGDKADYPELMVVLDLSRSMTARDVAPSRLERAKLELTDLIERAQRLKIGLLVYAARPHLLIPPTADKSVLRHYLQLLHHGLLPTEGSNLSAALAFVTTTFSAKSSARAVLLITDGEIQGDDVVAEQQVEDTVNQLRQQGIALYALGIGTPEGTTLMGQQGGWLHYRNEAQNETQNKSVISKLHEQRLTTLAMLGNGRYAAFAETDAEWRTLYDQGISRLPATDTGKEGDSLIVWRELYGWCLAPAVLLFLLTYWQPSRHSLPPTLLLFLAFSLSGLFYAPPSQAATDPWQQRAYQAYLNQSYRDAKKLYARTAGYVGRMGEGSSAYRLGEYQQAVQLFTQAILDADNDAQRANALFNLANSHYQLETYGNAIELYQDVLRYRPADQSAQLNLRIAQTLYAQQQRENNSGSMRRQGRGPRTAQLPDDTEITSGDLTLGENEDSVLPFTPDMVETQHGPGSDLISRGIHYAQPAAQQVEEFEDRQWNYAVTTAERIVLQANSLQVDESILWQRIFEIEEGFPAPVETPHELKGVRPW